MKRTFFKTAAISAVYLRNHALNVLKSLMRTPGKYRYQVIDGYIIKASVSPVAGTATIIDTPGTLACFRTSPPGTTYAQPLALGRDTFDSRANPQDGPYVPAVNGQPVPAFEFTKAPNTKDLTWVLGFTPESYARYAGARHHHMSFRADDAHTYSGWTSWHAAFYYKTPPELFQYGEETFYDPDNIWPMYDDPTVESFASLRVNSSVSAAVDESDFVVDTGVIQITGFTISDNYLTTLLGSGYRFLKNQWYRYSGYDYQRCAPIMVRVGDTYISAIPICKQVGSDIVHWGEASILFLCTRATVPEGTPVTAANLVLWHRVWAAKSQFPVPPVRPQYCQTLDVVFEFFGDVVARKDYLGQNGYSDGNLFGSTPNWTDSLTGAMETYMDGAVEKQRAVFRFRYCGVSHHSEWDGEGWLTSRSGGDGIVVATLTPENDASYTYPYFDSCDSLSLSGPDPYTTAFATILPYINAGTYELRVPVATIQTRKHNVVTVDLMSSQPRVRAFGSSSGSISMRGVKSYPANVNLVVASIHRTTTVNFSALGFGVQGLLGQMIGSVDGDYYPALGGAGSSAAPQFKQSRAMAMLSDDELGVVMQANTWWSKSGASVPNTFDSLPWVEPLSLIGINVVTGAVRVVGSIGLTAPLGTTPPLTVAQRRIVDSEGNVLVEGMYLVTKPMPHGTSRLLASAQSKVRISRDSGVTWSDYILPSGPLPEPFVEHPLDDGVRLENVAFLGTQLIDRPPGAASLKE